MGTLCDALAVVGAVEDDEAADDDDDDADDDCLPPAPLELEQVDEADDAIDLDFGFESVAALAAAALAADADADEGLTRIGFKVVVVRAPRTEVNALPPAAAAAAGAVTDA